MLAISLAFNIAVSYFLMKFYLSFGDFYHSHREQWKALLSNCKQQRDNQFNLTSIEVIGQGDDSMGIRLLELREKRGWTQTELSAVSGVSQQFISAVERGERVPNVYIALKLARALGVTVEELVEATDEGRDAEDTTECPVP